YQSDDSKVTVAKAASLNDTYQPKFEIINENGETNLAIDGIAIAEIEIKVFLKLVIPMVEKACGDSGANISSAIDGVFDIAHLFMGGEEEDATTKKLNEISDQIKALQTQLAQATSAIIDNATKNVLMAKIQEVDNSVDGLLNDGENYSVLTSAEKAIKRQDVDSEVAYLDVERKMQNLYSSKVVQSGSDERSGKSGNYTLINGLRELGVAITASNSSTSDKNIFETFDEFQRLDKNWQTQTLSARATFQEKNYQAYYWLYAMLVAGVVYDKELLNDRVVNYQSVIEAIDTQDKVGLPDEMVALMNQEKNTATQAISNLTEAIAQDDRYLATDETATPQTSIVKARMAIDEQFQAAQQTLETDQKLFVDSGIIHNNRLNKNFKSNLRIANGFSIAFLMKVRSFNNYWSDLDVLAIYYNYLDTSYVFYIFNQFLSSRTWSLKNYGDKISSYSHGTTYVYTDPTNNPFNRHRLFRSEAADVLAHLTSSDFEALKLNAENRGLTLRQDLIQAGFGTVYEAQEGVESIVPLSESSNSIWAGSYSFYDNYAWYIASKDLEANLRLDVLKADNVRDKKELQWRFKPTNNNASTGKSTYETNMEAVLVYAS
ncbi:MAG: hypothetical protein LBS33_07895, partial [Streptococcaceae bacterium]|nr:hypothetical protein [Streptococcaceae bacterium]